MVSIVTEPSEVTADWLSEVLSIHVTEITAHEAIGTGQMSRNFRFEFVADGLSSVVLKVPAEDRSLRELAASVYEREVRFYADLSGYDLHRLKSDCALGAWSGPFTAVLGAFAATDTERGDEMFIAMADRSAAQILDFDGQPYL